MMKNNRRQRFLPIASVLWLVTCCILPATAQQTQPSSNLDLLLEGSQSLRQSIGGWQENDRFSDDPSNDTFSTDLKDRLNKINSRLEVFRGMIEREQQALLQPAELRPRSNVGSDPAAAVTNNPPPEVLAGTSQPTESFQPTLPPPTSGFPSGKRVLTETVNPLELGNSLFMTGNFKSAIKNYEQVLNNSKDRSEQAWLRLMIACSQRLLGNLDQAESLFREVTNQRDAGQFASAHARWNLKLIEKRRAANAELEQLQNQLKQLTETKQP